MKKTLTCLIFINIFYVHSQSLAGQITYAIKPLDFEVKSKDSKVDFVYSEMKKRAEKQLYILDFNGSKSKFSIQETMDINTNTDEKEKLLQKVTSIAYATEDTYYYDKILNKIVIQKIDGNVLYKIEDLQWTISKQNKKIGEYLCYKATCNKKFMNKYGEIKERPIIAWFAPILPYHYGPKDFKGLPGLILELQENKGIYEATKIKISKNKEAAIKIPTGKMTEESVFNKKFEIIK